MSSSFTDAPHKIEGVLLDMDGTLADSALDIVPLLNSVLQDEGLAALDYTTARNHVSQGARALIRLGCNGLDEDRETAMFNQLLERYTQQPCIHTRLFDGMNELIEALSVSGRPWGIVSNKPEALTVAATEALELSIPPVCVIGGDTLEYRKPHPQPLLEAARRLQIPPSNCLYLGDDPRDMQAARAAGMFGVIAAFGYIEPGTDLDTWGGDLIIEHPRELQAWLEGGT